MNGNTARELHEHTATEQKLLDEVRRRIQEDESGERKKVVNAIMSAFLRKQIGSTQGLNPGERGVVLTVARELGFELKI